MSTRDGNLIPLCKVCSKRQALSASECCMLRVVCWWLDVDSCF